MKRKIFYSFHFAKDVMRVQLIRNIGSLEENKPVSINDWEKVKRGGEKAIKKWIEDTMYGRSCVVVLVGEETHKRPWVQYEIEYAWNNKKALLGIYIHNLKCPRNGKCKQGTNPFAQFTLKNGKKKLSDIVECINPKSSDAYNDIAKNIDSWIEDAIEIRNSI